MLWALALHDKAATDAQFRACLALVEHNAGDQRHLVSTAQTMALRAIGKPRPGLVPDVLELANRLQQSDDPNTRRVGGPIVKVFSPG